MGGVVGGGVKWTPSARTVPLRRTYPQCYLPRHQPHRFARILGHIVLICAHLPENGGNIGLSGRLARIINVFSAKTEVPVQSSSLIFTAILCAQLLLAPQTMAEDTPPIDCKSPKATTEVNYCAEKANEKADLELNALYKKLRDKLNQKDKDALAQIERKWVALRDEICEFETQPAESGTGWSGFNSDCLTRLTKNRLIDLKNALEFRQ